MTALDEGAFREFASLFGPRLRTFFARRGLTLDDAEDLAMSCITDVAMKAHMYRSEGGGRFAAWVFTIARRAQADWWRRHRPADALSEDLAMPGLEIEDGMRVAAIVDAVREAVAKLPEVDRRLLLLRDLEQNEPYSEIARHLGIRTTAARVRHLRSLRKLRSLLETDPRIQSLLNRDHRLSEA